MSNWNNRQMENPFLNAANKLCFTGNSVHQYSKFHKSRKSKFGSFSESEICSLLEIIPSGTAVKELMMNGEDVSGVEEFVKYDRDTGLAFFTNESNNIFVGIGNKIDMIEFASPGED